MYFNMFTGKGEFLSTPSARRATPARPCAAAAMPYFYPRPPRGGRHGVQNGRHFQNAISIHALREEGDIVLLIAARTGNKISIHALREEGDRSIAASSAFVQ